MSDTDDHEDPTRIAYMWRIVMSGGQVVEFRIRHSDVLVTFGALKGWQGWAKVPENNARSRANRRDNSYPSQPKLRHIPQRACYPACDRHRTHSHPLS